jgi:hypothetical protein
MRLSSVAIDVIVTTATMMTKAQVADAPPEEVIVSKGIPKRSRIIAPHADVIPIELMMSHPPF